MANTVTLLNYANTFGDWVVTTNLLAKENNDFAANNFTKPAGTLNLDGSGTGLKVANNAIVQGTLTVSGTNSGAVVQNALTVQGQIFATNSSGTGLVVSGTANVGTVNVQGSGIALNVANTSQLNILRVSGPTGITTLTSSGAANMQSVAANTYIATPLSYTTLGYANKTIANTDISAGSANIATNLYANNVFSNVAVQTPTLIVTDTANVEYLSANVHVNTETVMANVVQGTYGNFDEVSVSGNFTIIGQTVNDSDTLNLRGATPISGTDTASFGINRQSGLPDFTPNAQILFSNDTKTWSLRDIGGADANVFYNIVTEKYTANVTNAGLVQLSNSLSSSSITTALSSAGAKSLNDALVANTLSLQTQINNNVAILQAQITTNVSSLNSQIAANVAAMYPAINVAGNTFVGTTGTARPLNGVISYSSNNGVVISGQGNTVYINTPQDLRTTASPTFNNPTFTDFTLSSQLSSTSLTNILPTGTTSGYVLTTGGAGTYYWAAASGGSGGGTAPGTAISSSRLSYTATSGQTDFAAPVFTAGTSQTRVYQNGNRQSPSEYNESVTSLAGVAITGTAGQFSCTAASLSVNQAVVITGTSTGTGSISAGYYGGKVYYIKTTNGSTTFTLSESVGGAAITTVAGTTTGLTFSTLHKIVLSTGATTGDSILIEVDGYFLSPYYANTIPFTAPFGSIVSTANTVQLAIQDLETRKAPLASPAFTGTANAVTMATTVSNTTIATTAYVGAFANANYTFTHSITGNAGTVTNGVYTSSTYANPTWLTSLDASKLVTTSNARINTLGVGAAPDTANTGSIIATGDITAYYSDDRLKTKLGNIENALDKLLSLSGFYYEANQTAQDLGYQVKREVGVSAQQVQAVLPEVVTAAPIGHDYLTVKYDKLIPLVIEAIKELKAEVDALKGK